MHAAKRNGAAWGELPPHKRQQILQSMTEGFPAHYQQILERYYRRLADETPATEAAAAPEASEATADEGPHLYFEIRGENGIALDPADWLRRRR